MKNLDQFELDVTIKEVSQDVTPQNTTFVSIRLCTTVCAGETVVCTHGDECMA